MNDCLAFFWSGSSASAGSTREEKITTKLLAEIERRRDDLRHAQISVGVSKVAVKEAYKEYGRTSQAFQLAVTKLRRTQMRERTCTHVLSRLEDAHHMTAMREIAESAITALKGTKLNNNDFESLYSTVDDQAAIAQEARDQVDEIANCFALSDGDEDIDQLLKELGLEESVDIQQNNSSSPAVLQSDEPIVMPESPPNTQFATILNESNLPVERETF